MNANWIVGFTLFSFALFAFWMMAKRLAVHRYNAAINVPFSYNILIIIPGIVSVIIFNNSKFIVEYFNVIRFCSHSPNLDIDSWLFPKVISHCHEFFIFGIYDEHVRGLVIVLDFFFVLCFICYFPVFWFAEKNNYRKVKSNILNENLYFTRIRPFATIIIFLLIFMHVFVWSLVLIDTGSSRGYAALLSDYGIGAAIQAVLAPAGPFMFIRTITVLRILRERSDMIRQDHRTD